MVWLKVVRRLSANFCVALSFIFIFSRSCLGTYFIKQKRVIVTTKSCHANPRLLFLLFRIRNWRKNVFPVGLAPNTLCWVVGSKFISYSSVLLHWDLSFELLVICRLLVFWLFKNQFVSGNQKPLGHFAYGIYLIFERSKIKVQKLVGKPNKQILKGIVLA